MPNTSPLQQAVHHILEQRRQNLTPVKKSLENVRAFLAGLDALESSLRNAGGIAIPPELSNDLAGVALGEMRAAAREAETRLIRAEQRLSRDSVNIGVAGLARQGKSTLLKSFSGLDDQSIPAGGNDFCTAAPSAILNTGQFRATIALHNRESFFHATVLPYYQTFGLAPVPRDLQEFLSSPLPQMPSSASAKDRNLYLTLEDIRQSVPKVEHLLTGENISVDIRDVRKYVTKDKGNREYLAVRQAIVEAAFPAEGLPKELRLIDLPGLGELALNIETNLVRAVAEQADMVLIVRKPGAQGDGWGTKDTEILDIMRRAVPDLNLRDWLALILNHSNVAGDKNSDNVESMLRTKDQRDLGGIAVWSCDCSNPDEVRVKVIEPAMRILTERAGALDQARWHFAKQALEQVRGVSSSILEKLRGVLEAHSDSEVDMEFPSEMGKFLENLRGNLRQILAELRETGQAGIQAGGAIHSKLEELTSQVSRASDGDSVLGYSPLSINEIAGILRNAEGESTARDATARNTRLALSRFLASRLDPVFKEEVRSRKKKVASTLLEQPPLSKLLSVIGVSDTEDEDVFATVARCLSDRMPALKQAFARFGEFDITYDAVLHPVVRKMLHRLDPDEQEYTDDLGHWRSEGVARMDFAAVAKQLRTVMDTVAAELVYGLVENSSTSRLDFSETLYYTVKEFLDEILWSEQAESEWKRLLYENRQQLWADKYAARDTLERFVRSVLQSVNSLNGIVAQLPA